MSTPKAAQMADVASCPVATLSDSVCVAAAPATNATLVPLPNKLEASLHEASLGNKLRNSEMSPCCLATEAANADAPGPMAATAAGSYSGTATIDHLPASPAPLQA